MCMPKLIKDPVVILYLNDDIFSRFQFADVRKTKQWLASIFKVKDMGEVSY